MDILLLLKALRVTVWEYIVATSSAILSLSLTRGCPYTWQTQKPFLPHEACVYVIQSCLLIKSKASADFLLNQTLVNASQFDLKRLYLFAGPHRPQRAAGAGAAERRAWS